MKLTRRRFLRRTALVASSAAMASRLLRRSRAAEQPTGVPVQRITRGPKHHWFGYYDKFQFDPSDRYVLGLAWTLKELKENEQVG